MKHTLIEYANIFVDSPFFTGFVGAFTAMLLPSEKMGFFKRAAYIIVGALVAGYFSPLIIDLLGIESNHAQNAIVFVVGMIGMMVAGGLLKLGKEFKNNPVETWKKIKSIWRKK